MNDKPKELREFEDRVHVSFSDGSSSSRLHLRIVHTLTKRAALPVIIMSVLSF